MSQYADKTTTCRDCGKQFTFTAGEQEFYAQRGFSEPQRCAECRQARKAGRESGSHSSSDYGGSRGGYSDSGYGRSGGYASGSSYGSGGGYGSSHRSASAGTRQMFTATCADCGTTTEVPFEPRQGRPVYCRDCFERRNPRR